MTGFGHHGWIWVLALVALLALALYRRGRRLIGRQRYSEKRMRVRVIFIAAITVLALIPLARRGHAAEELGSAAAGFAVGIAIAAAALRFTQMGRDERGLWFVPNLYLGMGLVLLLIARYVYEYFEVLPQVRAQARAAAQGATPQIVAQPMLHGVLFLVLGYYVVYYGGVMLRARKLPESAAAAEGESE